MTDDMNQLAMQCLLPLKNRIAALILSSYFPELFQVLSVYIQ